MLVEGIESPTAVPQTAQTCAPSVMGEPHDEHVTAAIVARLDAVRPHLASRARTMGASVSRALR